VVEDEDFFIKHCSVEQRQAASTQLNKLLCVQPCPTAQGVAQVSGHFRAGGLLIQEGLDLIERGTVPSLGFYWFFLVRTWRQT
jgi:hypothetical protein